MNLYIRKRACLISLWTFFRYQSSSIKTERFLFPYFHSHKPENFSLHLPYISSNSRATRRRISTNYHRRDWFLPRTGTGYSRDRGRTCPNCRGCTRWRCTSGFRKVPPTPLRSTIWPVRDFFCKNHYEITKLFKFLRLF